MMKRAMTLGGILMLGGCVHLGYETKLKTKCELATKSDLRATDSELKCGMGIETTWLTVGR